MRRRRFNPTPLQWTAIALSSATVVTLVGAAVAQKVKGKKSTKGPDLPGVDTPGPIVVEDPAIVPTRSLEWQLVTSSTPGYPWEFPAMHATNYGTPSTFFNVGGPGVNSFDQLVVQVLGSALAMAGGNPQIASAQGQDENAELGRKLRRQVRKAIVVVGGINDLRYGQTNLNYAGGNDPNKPGGNPNAPMSSAYVLNEEGRSLNWLPRHADDITRIQAGEQVRRATRLDGEKLPEPNDGSDQMTLWIAAFDLAALVGPNPSIRFLKWSDGSSTLHPPPQIQALGVDMSGVKLPGV